jgi:uncharacterized glyoxalase superfamily protein PhnB
MNPNRSIPNAPVIPELAYTDVLAAAKWLCDHFGFQERLRIADHRVQLIASEGAVIVTQRDPLAGDLGSSHSIMVRLNNIDEHYRKTVSKGVRILHPVKSHPYGERQYNTQRRILKATSGPSRKLSTTSIPRPGAEY